VAFKALLLLYTAAAWSRVCVQSDVSEGSMVIELSSNEMSSASEAYCTTPCSLATLPVLTTC
jgi:hypothetical protein